MEPDLQKPGVKTTEFWLTMIVHVVAIIALIGGAIANEKMVQIAALATSMLSQLGYDACRAKVKTMGV